MHEAVTILMDEHRVIERVLGALETFALGLQGGKEVSRQDLRDFADFFRNFADRCHHGKEEDRLFEAMKGHGFPADYGPIAVMLAEHTEGRQHVGALAALGEGTGPLSEEEKASALSHALAYVPLLRGHILKEDNILYPMALQAVPGAELDGLVRSYGEFERGFMGAGEHERLHGLARSLAERFPPDPERMAAASSCFGCAGHV